MVITNLQINGAGWAFMVSGLSIVAMAWVFPFILRRYALMRRRHTNLYRFMLEDTELRMMTGFFLYGIGIAIFASAVYVRAIVVEAGAFNALAEFNGLAFWWLMAPAAILTCVGNAMILWDGFAGKRGKWACLIILSFSVVLWILGSALGKFLASVVSA